MAPPDPGETAPVFERPLVEPEGDRGSVPLTELLSEGPVLLCFYPRDFTPECIDQWCALRDYDWFTASDDVRVVGISASTATTHELFIDYLDLGFPLYSDPDREVADDYDLVYVPPGGPERVRRACFLIDGSQTIRYRWTVPEGNGADRSPDVTDIHDDVVEIVGEPETETFGFA